MISIIVPAKDAAKTLGECLQALLHQEGFLFDRDYEVIVVDDGSTDETAKIAQEVNVKVSSPIQSRTSSCTQCGCQDRQRDTAIIHGC